MFSLSGWSPILPTGFLVSRGTREPAPSPRPFAYGALTLFGRLFQNRSARTWGRFSCGSSPRRARRAGLGSSGSARRYSRNHCCFLFLRLLRCFSSPGSPPRVMHSREDDRGSLGRVSPFRHLRITGYVPLPGAFRSLSRLSSALSAKASTMRPLLHDRARGLGAGCASSFACPA